MCDPKSARPELVEGLSFSLRHNQPTGQGFDKLSLDGFWGWGVIA